MDLPTNTKRLHDGDQPETGQPNQPTNQPSGSVRILVINLWTHLRTQEGYMMVGDQSETGQPNQPTNQPTNLPAQCGFW